jgi:glucosamine--fructose-6-phosphate aminotransferase (isomerizing)
MSQLVAIYIFAAYLAKYMKNDIIISDKILNSLYDIPEVIDNFLKKENEIKELSLKYKYAKNFFFLARGLSYPTALEGALKLKEITHIAAEGYASGELKHGPLALIEDNVPVVVIAPKGPSYDGTMNNMEEVQSRGADVIAIVSEEEDLDDLEYQDVILMDKTIGELFAPLVYVVPLQLLSYYICVFKNLDPDMPRSLGRSITVN